MLSDKLQVFKHNYENLKGVVHLASDPEEVSRVLVNYIDQIEPDRIVVARLPEAVEESLTQICGERGIQLVRPADAAVPMPAAVDGAQLGIGRHNMRSQRPARCWKSPKMMPSGWSPHCRECISA